LPGVSPQPCIPDAHAQAWASLSVDSVKPSAASTCTLCHFNHSIPKLKGHPLTLEPSTSLPKSFFNAGSPDLLPLAVKFPFLPRSFEQVRCCSLLATSNLLAPAGPRPVYQFPD
jgi:hypothetical protein